MGHFSVEIYYLTGSTLNGNQQSDKSISSVAVHDEYGFPISTLKRPIVPKLWDVLHHAQFALNSSNSGGNHAVVHVGTLDIERIRQAIWLPILTASGNALVASLLIAIGSALILMSYYRRFIRLPIQELSHAVARTQQTGEHVTVSVGHETTITRFSEQFNLMQERLHESKQAQERLLLDKSRIAQALSDIVEKLEEEKKLREWHSYVIGTTLKTVSSDIMYIHPTNENMYPADNNSYSDRELVRSIFFNNINSMTIKSILQSDNFIVHRVNFLNESDETILVTIETEDKNGRRFLTKGIRLEDGSCSIVKSDVTDLWHLERGYRHIQKMEALSTLTGGIAHEFNNMLAVIVGNIDLLLLSNEFSEKSAIRLKTVNRVAARATSTVKQLLAITKQKGDKSENIVIQEYFDDVKNLLNAILGPNIVLHTNSTTEKCITVSQEELDGVIINLVKNSKEAFGDEGGIINVFAADASPDEAARRELDSRGEYVVLVVSDDGPGISPEVEERLFEPFYTTKSPGEGTGLGLWTVYAFARNSGGKVFCDSLPNGGAKFSIYLPTSEQPIENLPEGSLHDHIALCNLRILAVDDEESLIEILKSYFERQHNTICTTASNATFAAELIYEGGTNFFDLVVCDLALGDGSGVDVARVSKKVSPGTPVIALSGYISDPTYDLTVFDDVLTKPFSILQLANAITRLLGHNSHWPRKLVTTE